MCLSRFAIAGWSRVVAVRVMPLPQMAGKQWAGEVIASKDKTSVSDGFKELERDVELRKDGAHRLFLASEAYHKALSKRKANEGLNDSEKLLPVETLGIVMIIHGEEFAHESPFGRANCKIAKLQESFAQSFHDNFMTSLLRFAEDIKDYETLRKKLESRRLSYDAANAKYEKLKSGKKDKERERKDAEEDMLYAKARYEETKDEVEAHMHAIQDNEIVQLRELTGFLTLHINFVEQYLDVLKETRAKWPSDDTSNVSHTKHSFPTQKSGSVRSKNSAPRVPESSSDDEEEVPRSSSRPSSRPPSRPPSRPSSRSSSRPASRASRKRTDSTGTAGGDKEKDKRRLSVAGWASSAVGSVTGLGRKNKETFATLNDDPERDSGHGESDSTGTSGGLAASLHSLRHRSKSSGGQTTPKLPSRILQPPSRVRRKVVRALYDFSGSADELSFKVGDHIDVVHEVLDGWWKGELYGKQGLFPTAYTEEVLPEKPPLPKRVGRQDNQLGIRVGSDDSADERNEDDDDEDTHVHYGRPMAVTSPTTNSPFYGGASDAASIVSSTADYEDERNPEPPFIRAAPAQSSPPPIPRRLTAGELTSSGKKAPPPPPPRRATNGASASPLIPERHPSSSLGRATSGYLSAASSESSHSMGPGPQTAASSYMPARVTLNTRKIVVLGSRSVGKSSLIRQFVDNTYPDSYYPTVETTSRKTLTHNGKEYPCEIIDTAGQYAIGIHGYVLVYSITSRASFDMIHIIYDKIVNYGGVLSVPAVIVGSKADLYMNRQVSATDGQQLAREMNSAWIETSALRNENVGEVFELCLAEIEQENAPPPGSPQERTRRPGSLLGNTQQPCIGKYGPTYTLVFDLAGQMVETSGAWSKFIPPRVGRCTRWARQVTGWPAGTVEGRAPNQLIISNQPPRNSKNSVHNFAFKLAVDQ
ncbi:hypothetical protein GGX14DRAFT_405409 [Mycena pura]|uniref:BAR-domain-containing protein n=1 Tax=Mycena pura TaxID=153505 RepID=A0AAD6US76_9AGAR|nr:hypothetical protein GGX14DRAFT_405409 [Mycena pura]